jgi:hypothetical protein
MHRPSPSTSAPSIVAHARARLAINVVAGDHRARWSAVPVEAGAPPSDASLDGSALPGAGADREAEQATREMTDASEA